MRCKKVRNLLADYVDGILTQNERKLVEEHVNKCSQCYHELIILRTLSEVSLKVNYPPPLIWDNFIQILHKRIKSEVASVPVQRDGYLRKLIEVPIIITIVCLAFVSSFVMLNSFIPTGLEHYNDKNEQLIRQSESLFIADIISRTLIDEKDVKEIKRLSKFVKSIEQSRQYEYSQDLLMDISHARTFDTTESELNQDELIRSLLNSEVIHNDEYLAYDGGDM